MATASATPVSQITELCSCTLTSQLMLADDVETHTHDASVVNCGTACEL